MSAISSSQPPGRLLHNDKESLVEQKAKQDACRWGWRGCGEKNDPSTEWDMGQYESQATSSLVIGAILLEAIVAESAVPRRKQPLLPAHL